MGLAFVKGHGTRNDFVVLPDLEGGLGSRLDSALVAAICDRHGGIGADGVLRVIRDGGGWFMDYRNADGSTAEMCGNGVRVFARYLQREGLVDPAAPLEVVTRAGVRRVIFCEDGEISVDMGVVSVGGDVKIGIDGREYAAWAADAGNPHAVARVDSLDEVGDLCRAPAFDSADFPDGVNVEFVVSQAPRRLSMRVFERGVGETMSCGTGVCAAAAVVSRLDGVADAAYLVDVPGGRLSATVRGDGHVDLKGPAVLVAEGTWIG